MHDGTTPPHAREAGTRAILDALAQGDPDELLTLDALLSGLGRRAFGMLAFVCVLPAFIPIPIGGAISGPLLIMIGLQIAIGISWFSLVAAEMVSGEYGLGYLINTAYTKIQYPTIAIGMVTLGIVGYVTSAMVRLVGRWLTEWRERELGVRGS